ncbi:YdeI/OmpD-associated family protein [Myroides guanonis]|nr:YdeI/OmpD-associated family protein [Myroides guanonis]
MGKRISNLSIKTMNPKVDLFLEKAETWKEEMTQLRKIALKCDLTEDYKWLHPCYTYKGKNVVLIHAFKEYCALLFHKGALLKDEKKILIQQTENVQAARQLRFSNSDQIEEQQDIIKAYIEEAIQLEKDGAKVILKQTSDYKMPIELQNKLDEDTQLKKAFEALTPGRQRAYIFNITQAKQSKTREARIQKYIPKILEGKGIDDI